jgi:hypothetical protein
LIFSDAKSSDPWRPSAEDEAFLDDLEHKACLFFWEQGSPNTGQILDRARNNLTGERDPRRMASIASTGFGLTALCIADHRGYFPHAQIVERVRTTLQWHLNSMPEVHGFFYHFTDIETGGRYRGSELSSVDTTILLCGMLTARAYFDDPQIQSLAQQIYERVDWPWMLNGGKAFSMGWKPNSGFLANRWDHYCELMMIDLLAIGSPTHPVEPEVWDNFTRSKLDFAGYEFISGDDPLFTHQYSQAWFDFRGKRDAYADYFTNSITATRAHKAFCLAHPKWYSEDYWGVTASDYAGGRPNLARSSARRGNVALQRVIHHHAVGVEAPAQRANRPLHALDPAPRQPVAVAVVVERNHFVVQNAIEVFAVAAVVHIHVGVGSAPPMAKPFSPS